MGQIILQSARLNMFVMSYMYHSTAGFVNLIWCLCSFVFPIQVVFFLSIFIFIPILSWEFILIYGVRINHLNQLTLFKDLGEYYNW